MWREACSDALGGRLAGFAELAERFFQLFLGLAVGRPVAALDRVLASLPRFPGSLHEPGEGAREGRPGLPVRFARLRGLLTPDAPAENALERLLERRFHGDLVAERDDDAPELRQRSLLRREIDRLYVDQRFLDGNGEQRTADDTGALLVPEREGGRDHRVLVDA